MLIKTRGIILKAIKYSETSIITDIYTEEKGLQSYIVGGVRSKKPKMKAGYLQIMSLVEMVAYYQEDRKKLFRIKELKPTFIYNSLPFDVIKGAIGMFIIEIVRKTLHDAEENKLLFDYLFNLLIFIDETQKPVSNIHLHFMVMYSGYLGFKPNRIKENGETYYDLIEGIFTFVKPQHNHFLEKEETGFLKEILNSTLEECYRIRITGKMRRQLLNKLLDYYKIHIENLPEINSPRILHEVLG